MNQDNGGIIGKINTPTTSVASGVWSIEQQFEAQSSSIWPLAFPQTIIANTCRFDNDSSDYLNRTFTTDHGNVYKWTYSFWVKRSNLGSNQVMIGIRYSGSYYAQIKFTSNDDLEVNDYRTSYKLQKVTDRKFRDTSAWYHIVVSNDNSVASPETEIYVNGVKETSFSTTNEYSQNDKTSFNDDYPNYIGQKGTGDYFDGYMCEVIFVDGQALSQTSFGAFNPVTNIWEPIAYAGTYGTNGFKLNFSDSSNLGDDTSGNGSDFTVNNLTSIDQATDTPSNNFATISPLFKKPQTNPSELRDGDTSVIGGSAHRADVPTIAMNAGKWYFEAKAISGSTTKWWWGLGEAELLETKQDLGNTSNFIYGDVSNTQGVYDNNLKVDGSTAISSIFSAACAANDIVMLAVDLDDQKVWYGLNGTWNNGSATASTTFNSSSPDSTAIVAGDYYYFGVGNENTKWSVNYGNPAYSISSGNADANGHGNFEYAVPTGFFALCTKNISENG